MIGTSKFLSRLAALAIVTFCLVLFSTGCGEPSHRQILGRYYRTTSTLTEVIEFKGDNTYTQQLTYSNGAVLTATGSWSLRHRAVHLHSFYETYDIETRRDLDPPKRFDSATLVWDGGTLIASEAGQYDFRKKD